MFRSRRYLSVSPDSCAKLWAVSAHRRSTSPSSWHSWWSRFAARFGWRAYAVPVLLAITLTALVQGGAASASHPPVAPGGARAAGAVAADPSPITLRRNTDSDVCAGNGYARLALVSISQQHAWMCQKHQQVFSTPVTTGASFDGNGTPPGSWRVQARERNRDLVGPGYLDHVRYWVPFDGDYGFHDATWQTMPFGSPDYLTEGSHGCVHLPTPAMQWFYGWARVGDTVVTIEN